MGLKFNKDVFVKNLIAGTDTPEDKRARINNAADMEQLRFGKDAAMEQMRFGKEADMEQLKYKTKADQDFLTMKDEKETGKKRARVYGSLYALTGNAAFAQKTESSVSQVIGQPVTGVLKKIDPDDALMKEFNPDVLNAVADLNEVDPDGAAEMLKMAIEDRKTQAEINRKQQNADRTFNQTKTSADRTYELNKRKVDALETKNGGTGKGKNDLLARSEKDASIFVNGLNAQLATVSKVDKEGNITDSGWSEKPNAANKILEQVKQKNKKYEQMGSPIRIKTVNHPETNKIVGFTYEDTLTPAKTGVQNVNTGQDLTSIASQIKQAYMAKDFETARKLLEPLTPEQKNALRSMK